MDNPGYSPHAEEAFAAAVAEAERGYPPELIEAKTRPAGRPLQIGGQAATTVPVRLDPDRIAALDALARRNRETRSDVIRRAIDREIAIA